MNIELTKQLLQARRALRKKYRSIKGDVAKSQTKLEKSYQHITQPLKQLVSTLTAAPSIKPEISSPKYEPSKMYNQLTFLSPSETKSMLKHKKQPSFLANEETYETGNEEEEDEDIQPDMTREDQFIDDSISQFIQTIDDPMVLKEYFDQFNAPLPRDYIEGMVRDTSNKYDNVLGIFHNPVEDKFYIGDSEVAFIGPDINVKGITYTGTTGLYELLFLKQPLMYTKEDAKNYVDIVKRTNAYRKDNKPDTKVRIFPGDIKDKFIFIIKPHLLQTRARSGSMPSSSSSSLSLRKGAITRHMTRGKGMIEYTNRPVDYKYFDNFNEIIERLRLLHASQSAGNNGHNNEIISIIEELREGGIIL